MNAPSPIDERIQLAVQHQEAGRLAEAEAIYRSVLHLEPNNLKALHLLAILASQMGRPEVTAELLRRVVQLEPAYAEAHSDLGSALHSLGRNQEALVEFRHAVALKPEFGVAYNNLGNVLHEEKCYAEAVEAYERAIRHLPDFAEAHNNLGNALLAVDRTEEAMAAYARALHCNPQYPEGLFNLGIAFETCGRFDDAIAASRRAIALRPDYAEAHYLLGCALHGKGQLDEAIDSFHRVLALRPDHVHSQNDLGSALADKGLLDEAIAAYRKAIELDPDYAGAWNNLGVVLQTKWKLPEAIAACREAVRLQPGSVEPHYNLGNALRLSCRLDEAAEACREALRIDPHHAQSHNGLGNVLKDLGEIDSAVQEYRRAIELDPENIEAHSNYLLTLYYHPGYDGPAILKEAREWDRMHAESLKRFLERHENDPKPGRRLRIGYVSPDFRHHVAGSSVLPFLQNHDREEVEVFCYSNVLNPDGVTLKFQSAAHHWRNLIGVSDEQAAAMIRADGIDILVDLALHSARNRLLLFARKPAPIQICYLGYCGTTGLHTMDYRLSDPFLDPILNLESYGEETAYLPRSYWCYEPFEPTPVPAPLPASSAGFITFGCLNNYAKVSIDALELWLDILEALPDSRLLLNVPEGSPREKVLQKLRDRGLSASRLEMVAHQPWKDYVACLQRVDIALDPFPYGGGITSCDALWMGVPVVTLAGRTAVGRAARSLLFNLHLGDLVAESGEQYRTIAVSLAKDIPRLKELHSSLRGRVEGSSLRDPKSFARALEGIYRRLWVRWCGVRRAS